MNTLNDRVRRYIQLQHEGETWDFKREWHHEKFLLLHDIICMANTISDEDSLIIIGVDEENDCQIKDVTDNLERKDTQQLVTFLRDKKFAGEIRPEVRVESIRIDDKTIDVIVVKNTANTPYYLTQDFEGKVKAYYIYTRVEDTNTPIDKSADINRIESLWKKRFRIDKSPVERFQIYLNDYDNWDSIDGGQSYYYKLFPEFIIKEERDEDKNGYEYYCFSQINPNPSWYTVQLYYNGTILDYTTGVCLDGGRFFTVVPDAIFQVDELYFYGYYRDNLQYQLRQFFLNRIESVYYDSCIRWNECIPVFETKDEKDSFLSYLQGKEIEFSNKHLLSIPDKLKNGSSGVSYQIQYPKAIRIVQMLDEFRFEKGTIPSPSQTSPLIRDAFDPQKRNRVPGTKRGR